MASLLEIGDIQAAEAIGVEIVLKGLRNRIVDDDELLNFGLALFAGLYTAFRAPLLEKAHHDKQRKQQSARTQLW